MNSKMRSIGYYIHLHCLCKISWNFYRFADSENFHVFFIPLGYLNFIHLDVLCIIFHLSAQSINKQYNTIQYNSYIPKTIQIFIFLLMCFDLENVRIMHLVAPYSYVSPYIS